MHHDTSLMTEPMSANPNQRSDIEVHLFAAARAAAGTDFLRIPGTSVGDVVAALHAHGPKLAAVLPRCSYLVNGAAVHELDVALNSGDRLDVLPPFAGG